MQGTCKRRDRPSPGTFEMKRLKAAQPLVTVEAGPLSFLGRMNKGLGLSTELGLFFQEFSLSAATTRCHLWFVMCGRRRAELGQGAPGRSQLPRRLPCHPCACPAPWRFRALSSDHLPPVPSPEDARTESRASARPPAPRPGGRGVTASAASRPLRSSMG